MRLLTMPWLQHLRQRKLSPREEEIVHHLANAEYPQRIAHALGITVHTVEAHCHHIRQKWQVRNQPELYQRAYLYVYVPIDDAPHQPWMFYPHETN